MSMLLSDMLCHVDDAIKYLIRTLRIGSAIGLSAIEREQPVMPDDHSEVVPLLPIPNRTVKRLSADDSADSRVKVGHRQAIILETPSHCWAFFCIVPWSVEYAEVKS